MRPIRHVTAVLLLAAFAAVGCSKRETSETQESDSVRTKPLTASGESLAVKQTDGEGLVPDTTPKITGPVSFVDGEAAYQAGNYSHAAAIFEHYIGQRPNNAWGHYMLGLSAWKSGDLAKSEEAFETALSIDPYHVKSLVNLSRVFIDQKRTDDALDRLTRAADIDESAEVYRLLGRTYHARGETDEAVDAYRRAIALNERDAWSMNNLGLLFLETQRADEALPLLAKAVELRQDVAAFHNNLGMALEHTGRFKAAAAAYGGALSADPGYDKAKRNLARVEAVKSDFEEPFDVDRAAKGVVEEPEIPGDEKTASN
ncbi:MAG TPA: tetratricopeptide repeat protein [Vicinamibacterales bacterium]